MCADLPTGLWPLFMRLAVGEEAPASLSPEALHRLLTCATEEGLLPILFDDPLVPPGVREARARAPAIPSLYRRRLELHQTAARAFLDAVGVGSCLFVKGFDYRYRLYARPELRPSADIDVYVPPGRVDDVLARLRKAGYPIVASEGEALWGTAYYETGVDIGEVRLEIHRSFGHPVRTEVDYEEIWAAREPFRAGDFDAYRLAPLHAMGVHVLNLAKDELSSPLIRFVDLFLMLGRWPELVPALADLSRTWRIERGLYGSLRVATALFPELGTPEVERAMEGRLGTGVRGFLDALVIPDRRTASGGRRPGRALQLWRKCWLTDGVVRRARFLGSWASHRFRASFRRPPGGGDGVSGPAHPAVPGTARR